MAAEPEVIVRPPSTDDASSPKPPAKRHRTLKVVVAVLVALLVIAIAGVFGVGYYYSSQLLNVTHVEAGYPEQVISVTPTTFTVAYSSDNVRPGTYGLFWSTGHAIAGPVVSVTNSSSGQRVTRTYSAVTGSPFVPGLHYRMDALTWMTNPSAVGLQYSTVTIPQVEGAGAFGAWLIPATAGTQGTWAIFEHGRGGDLSDALRIVTPLHKAGLTTLVPHYRNDAGEAADPSGQYRLGTTEWKDLADAVTYARAQGAQKIVLVGWSYGGAVVGQYLSHVGDSQIKAIVLDSPVLDWTATINYQASKKSLPQPIGAAAGTITAVRTGEGMSLDGVSLEKNWDAWVAVPVFLVYGTADKTVPTEPVLTLQSQQHNNLQIMRVVGAGHTAEWNVNPAAYEAAIISFTSGFAQ